MGSSHKSKKKKKEKMKRKKNRRSSSSSSSNSSSSISSSSNDSADEWVEALPTKKSNEDSDDCDKSFKHHSDQRDEWMSAPMEFSGYTREQLKKKKEPKEDENKYMLDRLGQTDRELNPYWKDGGTGLPQESKDLSISSAAVGDYGVEWLRKALQRAKEQAAEENRRLEDVVAERWGSLQKLESMIKEAENRSKHKNDGHPENKSFNKYKEKSSSYYKRDQRCSQESYEKSYSSVKNYGFSKDTNPQKRQFMKQSENSDDYYQNKRKDKYRKYSDDESYDHRRCKDNELMKKILKPPADDTDYLYSSKRKKDDSRKSCLGSDGRKIDKNIKKQFLKPVDDDSSDSISHKKNQKNASRYSTSAGSSGKGWRKNPSSSGVVSSNTQPNVNEDTLKKLPGSTESNAEPNLSSQPVYLSADERNELAAKLIKAEIMGNMDLVKNLKNRLEKARTVASETEKTVILTHTDAKGFTQPLSLPSKPEYGRGRKEKTQTHEKGKRIRYFADDDKYSLQEMFEREKRSTVEDQNEMFARLASKNVGRDESANDMDDVFEDMVRVKESAGKSAARERDRAIDQHRRSNKAIESCQWCLDSKRLLKHLVITIGSKVFLCLPPYESLTEGHCLLIPSQHVLCATQLDEDVWEELQVFRKALVQMFLSIDMDVVFFECAMNFSHVPHMLWQCVPLPKESGDVAPIYFKKAILECETEWASNKKLVDLAGKNVRRAIPRGLPYFAVDFGLQSGFAHVIEDEKLFPKNFAQEVIGGMLDVDHRVWRKPKFQKFEEQRQKVVDFTKMWKPFDCIKQESCTTNK